MTATAGMVAGMYHAQLAMRDDAGYPMGQDTTPNTKTAPSTNNAYKIPGIVECTAPEPTIEIATRYAGQTIKGQRALGVSSFGSFNMTLSDYDETLNMLVGGATHDVTTMTGMDLSGPNMRSANIPQVFLLLSMGFQRDDGTNEFITHVYDNVQISKAIPRAGQSGGVNPNALTFTCTPSTSTRTVMGRLYSATALAVADLADVGVSYRHANPLGLTTFIRDGVATTFILGYRPTLSDVTGTNNNSLTNEGVTQAVTSISTTTGLVTLTAVGTNGHRFVVLYPTNFVAI